MANLSSAVATGLRVVRVTFDAALSDFSSSAATGALNPVNWTFIGQGVQPVPVAAVGPVSAAQVSTTVVDVTVDDDLSPGQTYQVTAKDAASGGITGVASSPNNRATFMAVLLTPPAERDFSTLKMVPRMNLREDDTQDLERFLRVLDDPLQLALYRVDHWPDILDYDLAPENFLDLMLQDLGYPFQIALSALDKRRLLSVLVTLYKQKGTVLGIKNVLRFFLGYESDVVFPASYRDVNTWILDVSFLDVDSVLGDTTYYDAYFQGSGLATTTPYDFYVKIGKPLAAALTADETTKANTIINYMKPAHTHLLGVSSVLPAPASPAAVGGSHSITFSWSPVTGATGYALMWARGPFVTPMTNEGDIDPDGASPYTLTGLATGDIRYGIICARNGTVNGLSSAVVTATAT